MPFTASHAVVALPFVRTPLVPAAIAIGSMTPDVPLFFRFGPDYWLTHSWWGALVVDLPLALLLLLIWRLLLRPATPDLVPRWFAERLPREWSDRRSGWISLWGRRGATASGRLRAVILPGCLLIAGLLISLIFGLPHASDVSIFFERSGTTGGAFYLVWLAGAAGFLALKRRDTPGMR